MNKPKVTLIGQDGNAFNILGLCKRAATKAKMPKETWREFQARAMSGDYDNLLATVCEYFEVT